ncbi:Chromosome 5 4 [Thoreauomyces humboldtii]|nr:Chromosome 5 4 [Thoreauomyces humboldtii]
MTTETMTATATEAAEAAATNYQRKATLASGRPFYNSSAPPIVDVKTGKAVPQSQRWGFSTDVFYNNEARSSVMALAVIGAFVAFNRSQTAYDFYLSIDQKYTEFQINSVGSFVLTFVLYWAFASIFAFIDLTGKPDFLFKYKVQPFLRVDVKDYAKISLIVLRNQFFVSLPLAVLSAFYFPFKMHPDHLQGSLETVGHIIFNQLCLEVGFYFIHRLFHSKALYARYHKQHHMLTAPVGLGATYCGIPEHVLSNLVPPVIGTAILRPHWSVAMFTFCFLEIGTILSHSGYNFPYCLSSLRHDWHHFAFTENYGPLGILDNLFGTARKYDQVMAEGTARCEGDRDQAREEMLTKLAAWEASGAPPSEAQKAKEQ